uniref:hypothetical protein n=1 Tax=Escherichia coli TaxID=562 RepID=UPI001F1A4C2E|nr:hypothetical protein [Escherichia coli]UGK56855.1 hypothetical protein [Escherichia coli]
MHPGGIDVLRQFHGKKIIIKPNSKLNTLYRVDGKNPTLPEDIAKKLARKESAQALYLYLAELPSTFYRIGFDRLRGRLQLSSHLGNQNATVKKRRWASLKRSVFWNTP